LAPPGKRSRRSSALARLADEVLEARDLADLSSLLTGTLPAILRLESAQLLLWDHKLESLEAPNGVETREAASGSAAAEARYLISEGQLLETAGGAGDGILLPLMARSGLVGMLVLGRRRGRRRIPYLASELRLLSLLATRAALALQTHIYQRELIASERLAAIGAMAGMLAHDFRGPMTVIRGYAESLLEGGVPTQELAARALLIVQAVDRLERMTTETLDFARGRARLVRRSVVLPRALEDLAEAVAAELPGLSVVRDFDLLETPAALDLDKLLRAISNMAANARDAMGGAGRFTLAARLEDGALVLTLSDEGPGVPEAIRERLFEPFVSHGKKGGTGLGLAVARRFVEDHGGAIVLLPGGPGARFRITVPLGGV
jgi:signal transduction histidine kinase